MTENLSSFRLTRGQIAWRAAQDIPEGAYVNLGIGMEMGKEAHSHLHVFPMVVLMCFLQYLLYPK